MEAHIAPAPIVRVDEEDVGLALPLRHIPAACGQRNQQKGGHP